MKEIEPAIVLAKLDFTIGAVAGDSNLALAAATG